MKSGSSIVKTMTSAFSEAWEQTPQPMGPPSTKRRRISRECKASTRTREASLEKIEWTGSIKIKKSLVDKKLGFTVESKSRSRSQNRSGSRPLNRAGSRDRWERWTENEDNIEKGKKGDSCH